MDIHTPKYQFGSDHRTRTSTRNRFESVGADGFVVERETPIKIRQRKYLNNIVEQDHRAIKRRTQHITC
jgi:putative transposase